MINAPVTSFCYPIGRFNARTRLLVQEADYISGVTTLQHDDYSDPYLLPRIRIHGNIDLTSFAWLVQNATTTY
jgi:peptidoglycan/xylan/chitin deacetylase (PgdA/CDA1 family)